MGTIKVVLAEDHALMRDAVKLVFERGRGRPVGRRGRERARPAALMTRVAADFVLLDVQLPGLDGLGCLEAPEHRPQVKVAMLSVVEDPQVIGSAFRERF